MPAFCGRSETAPSAPNAPIFLKSPFGADTQRRYDQCHNAHPFSGERINAPPVQPSPHAKQRKFSRRCVLMRPRTGQARSCIAFGHPDVEAGTSRNYTAPGAISAGNGHTLAVVMRLELSL